MSAPVRVVNAVDHEDSARLAEALAREMAPCDVIALSGGLGAGKTSFARPLIRALVGDPELTVPSPSFPLLQTYETPEGHEVWHLDLYRLSAAEEVEGLGLADAYEGDAMLIIEWPERIRRWLRGTRLLWINIAITGTTSRRLRLTAFHPAWRGRLVRMFSPQPSVTETRAAR